MWQHVSLLRKVYILLTSNVLFAFALPYVACLFLAFSYVFKPVKVFLAFVESVPMENVDLTSYMSYAYGALKEYEDVDILEF